MDSSRDELGDANFPDYDLDFVEMDWDGNCDGCPSGVVNGEHIEKTGPSSSLAQNDSSSRNYNDVSDRFQDRGARGEEKNGGENQADDEPMADGGVHPLLFPHVVHDVLSYLPARDVESFRLVCKVWNTEACKVLRTKRIVVLIDSDSVRVYNAAMRDTTDFPHAQFELCIQDFTGIVDENLREFWSVFGPHIKGLDFRQTHLFWRDFLDVVEDRVPNLEKLSLRHLPRNIRSRSMIHERHPLLSVKELRLASLPSLAGIAVERLTELLKSLPNLEVIEILPIKLATVRSRVSTVLVEILRKPDVNLPHLKRLDLNLELSNEGLEGLATKQFQFKRLNITLANGVKANSFKDLLNTLRTTLSELKISYPDSFSNYQSFVTQNGLMKPEECVQLLYKLKSLNMANFRGSINFVQNLPQLELLQFTTSNLEKAVPFGFMKAGGRSSNFGLTRMDDHSLKFLKIFSTNSSCKIAETLTLESISRCFPHLTCLHLQGVDDDGLGVIYRNLPFLSDVEFVKATCTDQGLTGIPLEICNDMVETSTFIVVQAERYRRDLFIGSLQFLRKFSIVATKISDASIALGLVDCKNLKELKIGSPLITDTGVIFVTDKFHKQLLSLDVSECTEITEQSKFYAGEKLIGKLSVADTSQDGTQPMKPAAKEVVSNPNRRIIRTKKSAGTSSFGTINTTLTSKFQNPDMEFFEEHSDDEIRERGFPHPAFPADHNNRLRIVRIREALRRNEDFMRNLQRMGLQQFRRLYGRDNQEIEPEGALPERNFVRFRRGRRIIGAHVAAQVRAAYAEVELPPPAVAEILINEAEENAAADEAAVDPNQDDDDQEVVIIEDDDGGPVAGEVGPDRLPENHLAEIFRLGLRLEDVEYWLRNRGLFERDDNANPNLDLRHIRADVLFAGMNLEDEAPLGGIVAGDDEDIDLEAIRRVVMNAFGDDLPFEG